MGYDCTLHVVDEQAIRQLLVPRVLRKKAQATAFDRLYDDPEDLIERARLKLDGNDPESACIAVCSLAIMFASAHLPSVSERGLALSLWDNFGKNLPELPSFFFNSPERMFAELIRKYPQLNDWPSQFYQNYMTGVFIPAELVPQARAWIEETRKLAPRPDHEYFMGLLQVLRTAEAMKLSYWEATDLPTCQVRTEKLVVEDLRIEGVREWQLTRSYRSGEPFRRGRWVFINLGDDSVDVLDLEAKPPQLTNWNCDRLRTAEPLPSGGWVMQTRFTDFEDNVRFPFWLHPEPVPGRSEANQLFDTVGPMLDDVFVFGNLVLAHDEKRLYRATRDGKLIPIEGLPEPKGREGRFGLQYTFGTVSLADGRKLLIWDGDGYEIIDGKLKLTWPLGINQKHNFHSVHDGGDGFYFIEDERLFHIRPGQERKMCVPDVYVRAIEPGPEGTLLLRVLDRVEDYDFRVWFPKTDEHISLRAEDLSANTRGAHMGGFFWSNATKHFYICGWTCVYTVLGKTLWSRPRLPVGALYVEPEPEKESKLSAPSAEAAQQMTRDEAIAALKELDAFVQDEEELVKSVSFHNFKCEDDGLRVLQWLPEVRELAIYEGSQMDGPGFAHLSGLPNLKELSLNELSRKALAHLASCAPLPSLRKLNLWDSELHDEHLAHIAQFTQLTSLSLSSTKVTISGLAALAPLTDLESLDVESLKGEPSEWLVLKQFPKLKQLNVRGCFTSSEPLAAIGELTSLESLDLAYFQANGGFRYLASLKNLKELQLYQVDFDAADIASLTELPLESIEAGTFRHGSNKPWDSGFDAAVHEIGRIRTLKSLELNDRDVSDAGVAGLVGLTDLEELNLAQTGVTGNGLQAIGKLVRLRSLRLDNLKIRGADLAPLTQLTSLKELSLFGATVGDKAIPFLAKLGSLESLGLENTKVTARGVRKLNAALPDCEIEY